MSGRRPRNHGAPGHTAECGIFHNMGCDCPPAPATLDADPVKMPPYEVELLGLSTIITVLERMTPAERRRSLNYLNDRYGKAAQ